MGEYFFVAFYGFLIFLGEGRGDRGVNELPPLHHERQELSLLHRLKIDVLFPRN
jgi:hypothetical protein